MSQTHYYYALNRKAAERITTLTWKQFLKKFGWRCPPSQWENIGGYLSFALDRPRLPEQPTQEELAPILQWKIRETIPRMGPQYFMMLELSNQLGRHSFVKADVDAEKQEDEVDAINSGAIFGFLDGDIDDRTLWCVLTIHEDWASDLFDRWNPPLPESDRDVINALKKRFGRCRPIFDWQTLRAVRDGHTVLHEEDTKRFVQFVELAWRENWPIWKANKRLRRFRDFDLARKLHAASPAMLGNCLVHYYGA
jgi:hypothetical protein